MKAKKTKLTILEVVSKILDSDLPMSTRNEITRYYLLPRIGMTESIIQNPKIDVGTVERPSAEDIRDNDPKVRAGDKATEKVMGLKDEEDE